MACPSYVESAVDREGLEPWSLESVPPGVLTPSLSILKLLTSFIHFPSTREPYVLSAVVCMVKYDFSGSLRW